MKIGNKLRIRHGMSETRFYHTWESMINRCSNKSHKGYRNYGGKGIRVCDKWKNFIGFKEDMYEDYLIHVKEYGEKETTLDRVQGQGNYCKLNTRWRTYLEQNFNKRTSKLITYMNISLPRSAWAKILGIGPTTLQSRQDLGWSDKDTIGRPIKRYKPRRKT